MEVPDDAKLTKWLAAMESRFDIVDGVLYFTDTAKDGQKQWLLYVPEAKLALRYYWPGMRQDVESFMRSCAICAERSGQGRLCKSPLGDMPIPPSRGKLWPWTF